METISRFQRCRQAQARLEVSRLINDTSDTVTVGFCSQLDVNVLIALMISRMMSISQNGMIQIGLILYKTLSPPFIAILIGPGFNDHPVSIAVEIM